MIGGEGILYARLFHILVHIILVNNQPDAQIIFRLCLFQFSTCFEHPCAHHQENQLYQYDIWYMSHYVGDRLACIPDGHLHRVTYNRYLIDTIESPDDEHLNAQNMYRIEINIYKKELCVPLVVYKNYAEMHGQQNIKFWYIYYISNPKNRDTKPFSIPKNELQYHSRFYNVACLMLPATLNSVEFHTETQERMLLHVILPSVNAASTLVSPQNKQGLKLNYCKQPM